MTIRTAIIEDVNRIATIHVQSWQNAFAGLISEEVLNGVTIELRQRMWTNVLSQLDPWVYVFVEDNTIKGFVAFRPLSQGDIKTIELNALYVDPSCQGEGVGCKLFWHAVAVARDKGFQSIKLWTLAGSRAHSFYLKMGGKNFEKKDVVIGGFTLPTEGYSWENIS